MLWSIHTAPSASWTTSTEQKHFPGSHLVLLTPVLQSSLQCRLPSPPSQRLTVPVRRSDATHKLHCGLRCHTKEHLSYNPSYKLSPSLASALVFCSLLLASSINSNWWRTYLAGGTDEKASAWGAKWPPEGASQSSIPHFPGEGTGDSTTRFHSTQLSHLTKRGQFSCCS